MPLKQEDLYALEFACSLLKQFEGIGPIQQFMQSVEKIEDYDFFEDEEKIDQKEWDRIYSETRIGKIIYDNTPTENYIDTNLMYIILIQKICKEFNIKLKIASALKPLWTFDPNDISLILKSKHNKELDLTSIMGYPFYKSAGGICAVEIKEWGEKYSVSSTDNHPNQAAHKLLADFFLGEKDIMNYR
jgi:hypothetical protein